MERAIRPHQAKPRLASGWGSGAAFGFSPMPMVREMIKVLRRIPRAYLDRVTEREVARAGRGVCGEQLAHDQRHVRRLRRAPRSAGDGRR